jgi:hypothetical protein
MVRSEECEVNCDPNEEFDEWLPQKLPGAQFGKRAESFRVDNDK